MDALRAEPQSGEDSSGQAGQDQTTDDQGPPGQDPGPRGRVSRRAVLGGALTGTVGLAAGWAAGRTKDSPAVPAATCPFTGTHQAGIDTPAQDRLHFAAFDLTTTSRADLVELLRAWTVMAARMTQGLAAGRYAMDGPYDAPPDDTGEAWDLSAANLTVTFGFGRSLFDDRFGLADRLPGGLVELPHFPADDLDPARSDGDLVVQACADDPQVAVHAVRNLARAAMGTAVVRWSQLGFGRTSSTSTAQTTPRNLFGFKDGTANIKTEEPADLDDHVWVPAAAAEADAATGVDSSWLVGGTYLVARRIRMFIEPWDRVTLREQERVFGRDKGEGAPLSGGTEFTDPDLERTGRGGTPLIDPSSHVFLGRPVNNSDCKMLRRGYNFTEGADGLGHLDAGLFFIAFVTDPRTHYIPMQTAMSRSDLLMEYIVHTGSGLWAVPPGVPELPTDADGAPVLTADAPHIGQALFAV